MKWTKLTAYTLVFISVFFLSCTTDQEIFDENYYVGNNLAMNGTNEVPAVTTAALGTINANYSKLSKTLSYSVTFSGLSANAIAAHIHGTAEAGFSAGVLQTFGSFPAAKSGTYNGTLYFDGIKMKEEDLLAGKLYINIHTSTNTGGEIRGQLILNKL